MNNISKVDNDTKNQLHENYLDDVEEFRRKTPNRFHEEKSTESPNEKNFLTYCQRKSKVYSLLFFALEI